MGSLVSFAKGSLSQARKIHKGFLDQLNRDPTFRDAFIQILKDFRPEWADDWINDLIDKRGDDWSFYLKYDQIRDLMDAGVIQRPTCDGYIRMVGNPSRGNVHPMQATELYTFEIWRLFEVDTEAFTWLPKLTDIDREHWATSIEVLKEEQELHHHYYHQDNWPRTLFYQSEQCVIDRGRLIDSTLAAYWRGFRVPIARGLLRFHDLMAPTDDEIAEREAVYRELLRCDNGQVVALALKALGRLHKAKRLDVVPFLHEVPSAFAISTKAQPKAALTLIDRVTKKTSEHRSAGLAAIHSALSHEHSDIQEQALNLVEAWKSIDPGLNLSSLLDCANNVAPQHRNRLEELAGAPSTSETTADDTTNLEERERSIHERLTTMPSELGAVTCLEEVSEAFTRSELPPAFAPPPEYPVLCGVEQITPIRDVDELIDAVSQLLENIESADDLERVMDGIVRLGGESTNAFEKKTAALRKLKIKADSWGPSTLKSFDMICGNVVRLIEAWLGHEFPREQTMLMFSISTPALAPLLARAETLRNRILNRQFGPTLGAPTHSGGWIDPRVFVERLKELQSSDIPIERADFIGGLLRLAPDFREAALQQATDLAGPHRRIVIFALGGNEQPTTDDSDCAEEWLAAGRSKNPSGVLDELRTLQSSAINESEPNSILPARYNWSPRPISNELDVMAMLCRRELYIELLPGPINGEGIAMRPATAVNTPLIEWSWQALIPGWIPCLITAQWPGNCEAMLAIGCCGLTSDLIDNNQTGGWPLANSLTPLLSVDRCWSKTARIALWLALFSNDEHAKGLAIDALIEGIADGRAGAEDLSETLVEVADGRWGKLNRLTEALGEVVKTSVLAEHVVAKILNRLIGSWEIIPRDGHHVLSLQLGLLTNLQGELPDQAKQVLGSIKGNGKAAKLAKQLCCLTAVAPSPMMRLAALEAAEGRLSRAERISNHSRH
ncbi:hypothetical protein Pan258_18790 [Symmachiella dynata]|uniref:DUF6493 family protein n=1 Tax=Symmachiella dynata TaxID=2527995 RepID=UPI001189A346|nr:DUF6493 family protein [Symmachiella dynata]QDT47841.1 hypothetical protein Pan258_18790 [Symmachiella dynata]